MTLPTETARFSVRAARAEDLEEIHRLLRELGYDALALRDLAGVFTPMLADPRAAIRLADGGDGSALLGLMTLSERPQLRLAGPVVTVDELVVAEGARGLGIGQALLVEAKAIATARGAIRLELLTNRTRESYQRQFYVKSGFTEATSAVMRWLPTLPPVATADEASGERD